MAVLEHGSIGHFIANSMMLFIFAPPLYRFLGLSGLAFVALTAAIAGHAVQVAADSIADISAPVIGASSMAFGVMTALAQLSPHRQVLRLVTVVCAVISLILAVSVPTSQTAHASHLGGMVGGFFAASLLRRLALLLKSEGGTSEVKVNPMRSELGQVSTQGDACNDSPHA